MSQNLKTIKNAQLIPTTKPLIKIIFPFNYDDLNNVKTLSGRKFHANEYPKYWTCPLNIDSIKSLKGWGFVLDEKLNTFLEKKKLPVNTIPDNLQIPGLKKHLMPFQKKAVIFIEAKDGRALIADEQGLGKTIESVAWLQLHPEKRPAIIVVPATLKLNWETEAHDWMSNPKTQLLSGEKGKPLQTTKDIIIINYDILPNQYEKYIDSRGKKKEREIINTGWVDFLIACDPKILITDECFPAGTKIATPEGDKNIEGIKAGDFVYNALGIGTVQKTGKRKAHELLRLHLSNSKQIDVTVNHPFFTNEGWVPAKDSEGKFLLTSSDIFNIMSDASVSKNKGVYDEENKKEMRMVRGNNDNNICRKTILREILLSEMEEHTSRNKNKPAISRKEQKTKRGNEKGACKKSTNSKRCLRKNEKEQSHIPTRSDGKDKNPLGKIWTPINKTTTKRRKWSSITKGAKNIISSARKRLETRISNKDKTKKRYFRIPNLLQGGFSITKKENMDRDRRLGTPNKRGTGKRPEKRKIIERIRVERVEILESGNRKQSTESTVYNLEISEHPSYYAEAVLVHNCHLYKSNTAHRTKAIKKLGKHIPHIIALSGTPIISRPVELFNAIKLVDPTVVSNFWAYAQRYCGAKHNGFGWDFTGASHTEELHEKLTNSIMLRRLKKDVLPDLPDKMHTVLAMEIDNSTEYRQAENNFIAWITENKGKKAAEKASNAEAFAQIETLKQLAIKGKMKQCIEWIENFLHTDEKLVVFTTHKNTIDTLMQKFGEKAVKIDGSVSGQARQDAVHQFQNDNTCKLFIGNIKAAGIGITLTAASNIAFLELPWTPGEVVQAEDRCHRIGQKNAVNIYYLLGSKTIDEKIAQMLDGKKKILDSVLDGTETVQESLLTSLINEYKEKSK